jgi:hypothetical protein
VPPVKEIAPPALIVPVSGVLAPALVMVVVTAPAGVITVL